jgi:hypothetical protein
LRIGKREWLKSKYICKVSLEPIFYILLKHSKMKFFIAFMLLFFTNCLAPAAISATVNSNIVALNSTTHSKKTDDKRVEKGKKLKRIAAYLLAIAFLCFIVVPKGGIGFTPAQIIITILFFACLFSSAILFLIGLAMQHHWN